MNDSPASFLAFANQLADEASALAIDYFERLTEIDPRRKSDGTLVTLADEAVDRLIVQRIGERFPAHGVLSEEQTTRYDPSHRYTWVIDPIDGTTNFARGLPLWGVSIGLLDEGKPVMGVVDFPVLRQRYAARQGAGATQNGRPIYTTPLTELDNVHLMTQCTRTPRRYHLDVPLKRRMLGSVTVHFAQIASGAAVAGVESTPKIWDLAAVTPILLEAGGVIASVIGQPLFPLKKATTDYAKIDSPTIAAANANILAQIQSRITKR